jgi:hypothetical protein
MHLAAIVPTPPTALSHRWLEQTVPGESTAWALIRLPI